jgi:TRAP-type uncharacterized transport system substrate-binding protein
VELKSWKPGQPRIERSLTLQFIGDWGQANFHRICSWLCQEFCDRAGPESRVGIWNTVGGGIDAMAAVFDGEVDLCIATPAGALSAALTGTAIFSGRPMPSLRALAVLPQNDKMVLAVAGDLGIRSFEELRQKRPPLRIATSVDDGCNLIGYTAQRLMAAHGIDADTLRSWGGSYVESVRPEQSLFHMRDGEVDAVLQEAIMTPWWRQAMERRRAVALAAEPQALARLNAEYGWKQNDLPAGFLPNQPERVAALDFSDFAVVVRDDMPEDVAHLLTWCLVETREAIEQQFRHIPPERSPLSYPLDPEKMARPPLPLHPGARRYYAGAGFIPQDTSRTRNSQ